MRRATAGPSRVCCPATSSNLVAIASVRDMDQDAFPAFCREHGFKCTAQRLAVFASVRAATGHPSVDEVWGAVRRNIQTITRESVYRILNEFAEVGLIGRLDSLASARYDTNASPHTHFICERCGKIIDYPMPNGIPIPEGIAGTSRHLELRITGVCGECLNRH